MLVKQESEFHLLDFLVEMLCFLENVCNLTIIYSIITGATCRLQAVPEPHQEPAIVMRQVLVVFPDKV
jgi:hypothetical protein